MYAQLAQARQATETPNEAADARALLRIVTNTRIHTAVPVGIPDGEAVSWFRAVIAIHKRPGSDPEDAAWTRADAKKQHEVTPLRRTGTTHKAGPTSRAVGQRHWRLP